MEGSACAMTECKYCGATIYWKKTTDGKFVPCEDPALTKVHACQKPATVEPLSGEEIAWFRKFRSALKELQK